MKGNKPLDRDYFKYKDRPKRESDKDFTSCCGLDTSRDILNVKSKHDWKLIEDYIEEQLRIYSNTEKITPVSCEAVSCEVCGRLLEYVCKLKQDKNLWR